MRVTFEPDDEKKIVFSIRNRVVDVVNDAEKLRSKRLSSLRLASAFSLNKN